ncbi:hypothetical protein Daus18300_003280 [Diaporthe australafricana]|uniref:Apple domain-containing protein n=1 Tax=Diaporthe australafricana TaxID=127596 RepID=A0ABR3XHY5_9PEZI
MSPSNDQAPDGPDPDGQKVRVQSGTTGAKMAADKPSSHDPPERVFKLTPAANNSNTTTPSNVTDDDSRRQINRDDYSGLQVVETGLEVPHSALPEVLPPSLPEAVYAEQHGKAWGEHWSPPPQALIPSSSPSHHYHNNNGGNGYPFPEAVSPDAYTPLGPGYSKASSSATYHGGHNPFSPEGGEKGRRAGADGRICGLRKMIFWCVLAVAVFVVVVGVAVGVGVGLGTRDNESSTNATSTATASSSSIDLTVPSATATAAALPSSRIVCPTANRTVYNLDESTSSNNRSGSFLVLCGRDYNSCCGAVDMLTVNTTSFEACLEQCAGQEGCTAVGWGNYYGTNTCWLKSAYGTPNWSGSWYAAIMVDAIS